MPIINEKEIFLENIKEYTHNLKDFFKNIYKIKKNIYKKNFKEVYKEID